jgi:hypothetical protein
MPDNEKIRGCDAPVSNRGMRVDNKILINRVVFDRAPNYLFFSFPYSNRMCGRGVIDRVAGAFAHAVAHFL